MGNFFRELSDQEAAEFRQWARDNYTRGSEINPLWHPVVRDECAEMNFEQYPCDDCNAQAGEQCRPYCTGKAAHDQDSGKQST